MLIKRNKKEATTENVVASNTEVKKFEISLDNDIINFAKDIKIFFDKYSELSKDDEDEYYNLCVNNLDELNHLIIKHNLVGKYIPIPQFQLIADTLGIDINTESIFDGYICIYFDDCACISLEYNLINFDMFFQEC